jgi:DNA-binding CsgD family transcriptional regulator
MATQTSRKKALEPTLERDGLLRKLYVDEGMKQSQIARELGLSRQRVYQLIDELKIKRRKRLTRPERQKKIPALIRAGLSGREIAQHLQIDRSVLYLDIEGLRPTMSQRLLDQYYENGTSRRVEKAKGRAIPKFAETIARRRGAILALVDQGKTLGQIGARFKVSAQTIRNDLTAMGVSRRVEAKVHANRVAQSARTRAKNAK